MYNYSIQLNKIERVLQEEEIESQKMRINSELMELARSRTRLASQIIDTSDVFEQDELNMQLEEHAGQFAQLRQTLLKLPLTVDERSILNTHNIIVPVILPAQRTAVELAMQQTEDANARSQKILYEIVLPGQGKLVTSFGDLITIEQQRITELTNKTLTSLLIEKQQTTILVATMIIIATMFSIIVILRIRKIQQDLNLSHKNLELKVEERTRELSRLNQKLKDASEHDELTNLYNRRKFNIFLENEYERTNRLNSKFALIMIDIDYFKQYNDHYGHQEGDHCLTQVASIMSMCLPRSIDFIARYGGEEFVVILPSTDIEGAKIVAEHIRKSVYDKKIQHENSDIEKYVTVSLGLTIYNEKDTSSIEDIIESADQCLYTAKLKGRNRIVSMD